MTDTSKSAADLLEDLRREREELNTLIQALEKRLGISPTDMRSEPDSSKGASKVNVSLDGLQVGFFHNLSQAAAAEKLLRVNPHRPLTTPEMLEAFRKSGMDVSGKNASTILYTALKRSPKFERVGGKAWGLSEWYPQKKRQKEDMAASEDK